MSDLFDQIASFEDVREELVTIPQWGDVEVLFRGMSYAALEAMREMDLVAAQSGDIAQGIKLLQATMCDPETKELLFTGEKGTKVLSGKSYEAILFCVNNGALVVLGVDQAETAGKDSSSTEQDSPTPDA